ncbi:MAG: PKD domain-containing protein, partial [Saprospiraceae bacterium]|nr:PKD domain-containing protein [Saprospiraceae bacterium]
GGDYDFTLKVYRDCNCTGCAQLDPGASIAIYRCNSGDCSNLGQNDFFGRLNVPLQTITDIEAPDYPCLIPPNVCVEEGIYRFRLSDYGLRLPPGDVSYHISYQRCCRNVTINNIVRPQDFGATYTIEITPEAQELCNDSPEFNFFPPTVICNEAPLSFDHSATDPDGDQLVYEFCNPLQGGGTFLDDQFETCEGAAPNPPCPPPYDPIRFILPAYSALEPMGGDPVIKIDPNTGLITGTPRTQGQFVVGVCVSEYRDGVLLSRVFRDFQFNVASCDPTVVADVMEDAIIGEREFLINSCGEYQVTFVNESFQRTFIDFFEWSFNIDGQIETFDDWSPTVTFPGVGQYNGQLILNPNTDCGDTASIFVNVFPDITADFSFQYDTCVAGPVQFTDLSETGGEFLTDWNWEFGDGNRSPEQNPQHLYRSPGNIPVTLSVTDNNQCVDEITQNIPYFPVPALIVVSPSAFEGCSPAEIFFNNLSFPIDETYDIRWDFGDGGTDTLISPTHTYVDPGIYTVSLDIVSPIGCETDTIFNDLITVLQSPEAGFTFMPEQPSNIFPRVSFQDESERAISWLWDFGAGADSRLRNPTFVFPDTGLYEVRQVVTHPNGCRDTLVQLIDVVPEVRYFLPNAFTPNSDSVNDGYRGVGFVKGATDFQMTIWNRWGEMIFQTSDPTEAWNGRKMNTGGASPPGVYVVLVTFKGPRGERFEFKEFATLIR